MSKSRVTRLVSGADRVVLDQLTGDLLEQAWADVEPLLRAACDPVATTMTPDLIRQREGEGAIMVWAIYRKDRPLPLLGAAATSIRDTNKGLTSVIEALAGHDFDSWWRPVLQQFEAMAVEHGIARMEIEGRMGWLRKLGGDFRATRVVMERDLNAQRR